MTKAKKEQTKTQKIISRVISAFFGLLFLFVLVLLIVCLVQINTKGEASVFGYKIYTVLTDSMTPELPKGSYFLAKETTADQLKEGDYVVYTAEGGKVKGFNVTHAVVIPATEQSDDTFSLEIEDDGSLIFRDLDDTFALSSLRLQRVENTCIYKGDNGKEYILTQSILPNAPVDDPVPVSNVKAKFTAKLNISGLQPFLKFLTSVKGYVILIALPLIILAVVQVFVVIKKYRLEKEKEEAEKRGESPEQLLEKAQEERRLAEEEIARKAVEEFIKQRAIEEYKASEIEKENPQISTDEDKNE